MSYAIEFVESSIKKAGTPQRRAAYIAAHAVLEAIDHEHNPLNISTKKLKQILIVAAQEHGWYAQDMGALRVPMPKDVPIGMKCCRKCREIKPADEFNATPTPERIKRYGWKPDTTQKVRSHLCTPCRKAHQQAQSRKAARRSKTRTLESLNLSKQFLEDNPDFIKRLAAYQKLANNLNTHKARIRAAFTNARKRLELPDVGVVYEYQFASDELRRFYESKKALVNAALDRLEIKFGETSPLPVAWGMLLTEEEQRGLAELHAEAALSVPSKRLPSLWQTDNVKPKE